MIRVTNGNKLVLLEKTKIILAGETPITISTNLLLLILLELAEMGVV